MERTVDQPMPADTESLRDEAIAPGAILRELLLPLEPQAFLAEYWETKTVLLRDPARLRSSLMRLASGAREELLRVLDEGRAEQIGILGFRPEDFPAAKPLLPAEVKALIEGGGTVYLREIQQCIPHLATLVNHLKADLDYPGPIANDTFWSSRGFGLDLHFDLTTTFTLQMHGTKAWRVGRCPAVRGPKHRGFALNGQYYTVGGTSLPVPEPDHFMEVVLEPGDVLYVPAGTWHEAKGMEQSFAITFKIPPYDVWDEIVVPLLKSLLPDSIDWRQIPPGLAGRELADYLGERRREIASALEQLDAGSAPLRALWDDAVRRDQTEFRSTERRADTRPLQPSDRLAVSRVHALTSASVRSPTGADEVVLFHGATRAHFDVAMLSLAQKVIAAARFSVAEAVAWEGAPPADAVHEFLSKLLRVGMLERSNVVKSEQMSSVKRALLSKWTQRGST